MEGAPAPPDAVGDGSGAAGRWKMRQLRCGREAVGQQKMRQGGWEVCAGEEDDELVSELNLLKNVFRSFALCRLHPSDPFA